MYSTGKSEHNVYMYIATVVIVTEFMLSVMLPYAHYSSSEIELCVVYFLIAGAVRRDWCHVVSCI